jgi:glutathione synthase
MADARRALFIMDPIQGIDIDADSTFVLMLEAQARGIALDVADAADLYLEGGTPGIRARPVRVQRTRGAHADVGSPETRGLNEYRAIFMRKDPPFDVDYFLATLILDRVDRDRVVMVNEPQALRDYNEKLGALYWPELMVPTLVTADRKRLADFVAEHAPCIVKPVITAGGEGVIRLAKNDKNTGSVLDLLTQFGRRMIEAQKFIPEVTEGDRRVILVDGEPVGAINRIPSATDIRANMHVGGRAEAIALSDRDREISEALGPELRRRGLILVGFDVIGGYLTEVNVTSPTGLQELARFDGIYAERLVWDAVERRGL